MHAISKETHMRVRWWQSIRWRLALGSMLVALLATALLASAVIVAINYYYTVDLRERLSTIGSNTAQRMGMSYALSERPSRAVSEALPATTGASVQNQAYL